MYKRIKPYGILAIAALVMLACSPNPIEPARTDTADAKTEQAWSCPMHPQVQQSEPGDCPLCGMDLVLLEPGALAKQAVYETTDAARALMDIQTTTVERRYVETIIQLVGKVDFDETRLATISSWVPGRLDRLYVDYTGVTVTKGDHLVSLYSPEVLAAQEELRRAAGAKSRLKTNAPESLRRASQTTLEAARSKLRRWGLTDAQVRQAESSGTASDHITIYAPIGGTVIERTGSEGMYVDTGSPIYRIADLSTVWVRLEAYESDLAWLHYGQTVSCTTTAYPGETFSGTIAFIDPMLNPNTRTVRVRVNVPNPDGKLKPEMLVRGKVTAQVAGEGKVMDPGLAGKWISPMHPEIVKDGPGACDICGMALVKAETLGYVPREEGERFKPLVVPASAVLVTGVRAVAYVELTDTEVPTYEGREVVLGPRAGDFYIVEQGLMEGERVVTNGNFKIDSALQILAKPSMMQPHQHENSAAEGSATEGSTTEAVSAS